MKRLLVTLASWSLLAGCQQAASPASDSVEKRLEAQIAGTEAKDAETVSYVAAFDSTAEADEHAAEAAKSGAQVERVEASGRLLKVTAPKTALKNLKLAATARASLNTRIRISRPAAAHPADERLAAEGDAAEAFLTARAVVGVERLLAKVPQADGRGQTVAVFDTGVDFGIEGLSDSAKLKGFYDLTGFGKVSAQTLDSDAPRNSYEIDGKVVTFNVDVQPSKIFAVASLSEAELSKNYLWFESSDINGDGRETVYPFLIGQNRDGQPAVFIDADANGVIESRAGEELTDFNTTHKHIDLNRSTPSNGHPLAVTITGQNTVQFHAVLAGGGHGTSCAIIIAGDGYAGGRLRGMAPKADILGYVLDVEGQDVYTIDQFLQTFAHAKAQGADAISISWGFSTADLASARFIGDWIDREIAAAGIVVGIAAGNGGPAMTTAASDDYVPHEGFAVGAHISEAQALNVYGWTGVTGDSVIHYSSIGPTLGGRQVPDVVSPLMTLVRGERSVASPRFYGFGGTSSATPALIGAVTALSSALKATGEAQIVPRLLKLAVLASASNVDQVTKVRQGAGLIDVEKAFDIYKRIAAEQRAAEADQARRTRFAYDLRAETTLPGEVLKGEGLHFKQFVASSDVKVVMTDASKRLIDHFTFVEPLTVSHSGTFFQTPDVVTMQATGVTFVVRFDAAALQRPGVHSDVIEIKRSSDGLTLLRIPVVVEIPARADSTRTLATVSQEVQPFEVWRLPVNLAEASAIRFDGVALDLGGNRNARANVAIASTDGRYAFLKPKALTGPTALLNYQTDVLPAGHYELLVYRTFPVGAALGRMSITGSFRLPAATAKAVAVEDDALRVVLQVNDNLNIVGEKLTVQGEALSTLLDLVADAPRKGFYGTLTLPFATDVLKIGFRQSEIDRATERFQNLETTIFEADQPLYRGWVEAAQDQPLGEIALSRATTDLKLLAYPNIVNWDRVRTRAIWLDVDAVLAEPATRSLSSAFAARDGRLVELVFPAEEGQAALPAHGFGSLELTAADGSTETVSLRW